MLGEDFANLLADRLVNVETRLDESEIGTTLALRRDRRHGRTHAKFGRFITRGGDNSAFA
jgi:hypothetical protein